MEGRSLLLFCARAVQVAPRRNRVARARTSAHTPEPMLPLPFYAHWPRATRSEAQALWTYHRACWGSLVGDAVSSETLVAAVEACLAHDLDAALLETQAEALREAPQPLRFTTSADLRDFADDTAGAHATLLAHLGGVKRPGAQEAVREMARALFYTSRLAKLAEDIARGRLYIPLEDLRQHGLSVGNLSGATSGSEAEAVRKVLWKQGVRARDAFSHAHRLDGELSGPLRRSFRRAWYGALEVLTQAEKRGVRLLEEPVRLNAFHLAQARLLARVGRATFR